MHSATGGLMSLDYSPISEGVSRNDGGWLIEVAPRSGGASVGWFANHGGGEGDAY